MSSGTVSYRPEIDGLRAVAVVPVILFHAGFDAFSGGYVGVDVFFVISGYLITSFILAEQTSGSFSLATFYARRARRILPALFLVLLCSAVLAWLLMWPWPIVQFSRSLAANAAFLSNFYFSNVSGYFGVEAEETPLLHTWSLAVEEQFYVLFPLAVLLIWRLGPIWLGRILAATALASLAFAEWASRSYPDMAFYMAPTRAWELLAGAMCALLQSRRGRMGNGPLALAGLGLICLGIFGYDATTRFPSLYTLAPVAGAALVVLFATPNTLVARALSTRAMVLVGLMSYSLYLWHYPLFSFTRIAGFYEPTMAMKVALIALTAALAWATWRFVEQPFRKLPAQGPHAWRILGGAAIGAVAIGAAGGIGLALAPVEAIWLAGKSERVGDLYRLVRDTKGFDHDSYDNGDCKFDAYDFSEATIARHKACFERYGPGVVILGDSHGINIYRAIAQNTDFPNVLGVISGGCRPHAPRPQCRYSQFADYAHAHPERFERVIFTQGGYYLLQDEQGRPGYWQMFDRHTLPLYRMKPETAVAVFDYLADLARSVDVVWLGPRLEPSLELRGILRSGCAPGDFKMRDNIPEMFTLLDRDLERLVAQRNTSRRLRYVSEMRIVDFDIATDFGNCQELYYADRNHWSLAGEARFGPILAGALMPPKPFSDLGQQPPASPETR